MTTTSSTTSTAAQQSTIPSYPKGSKLSSWASSTDHKTIGYMYLITSFGFFLAARMMALTMRSELARPNLQFLGPDQYNQLFTMHGAIMLLLFATPTFLGFTNVIMPLQIGAPDLAFPRMTRSTSGRCSSAST